MALYTFLAKSAFGDGEHIEQVSLCSEMETNTHSDSPKVKGKDQIDSSTSKRLESKLKSVNLKDNFEGHNASHNILVELADCVVDSATEVRGLKQHLQQGSCTKSHLESSYCCNNERPSLCNSFSYMDDVRSLCSYPEIPNGVGTSALAGGGVAMEGPSNEGSCYQLNDNNWLAGNQRHCNPMNSSYNGLMPNEWERCGMPSLSWGGRIVGRRQVKGYAKANCGASAEEHDAFFNVFEGGSLLYCNMSFEALLNVRKHLEELGFPCKAVNDSLWLQV